MTDTVEDFIDKALIITEDLNDKMSKEDMIALYKEVYPGKQIADRHFVMGLQSKGIKYLWNERAGPGCSKGCYKGVKKADQEDYMEVDFAKNSSLFNDPSGSVNQRVCVNDTSDYKTLYYDGQKEVLLLRQRIAELEKKRSEQDNNSISDLSSIGETSIDESVEEKPKKKVLVKKIVKEMVKKPVLSDEVIKSQSKGISYNDTSKNNLMTCLDLFA